MGSNNQQASAESKQERKPYTIDLEEHLPFNGVASTAIITSKQFCSCLNELFHQVFADYEGSKFIIPQNGGRPTIDLVFNHGNYENADLPVACENATKPNAGKGQNSILEIARGRDRLMKEGDRFYLTQDGQDIIKPLLDPYHFNRGKINWGNIIFPTTDGNNMMQIYGYRQQQYSEVTGLDLNRLADLLYGVKDKDGKIYQNHVDIKAPGSNGPVYGAPLYIFWITRVSQDTVQEVYQSLGIGTGTSSIIR
jgi:hypothetical protein